jgi:hypothetical protein
MQTRITHPLGILCGIAIIKYIDKMLKYAYSIARGQVALQAVRNALIRHFLCGTAGASPHPKITHGLIIHLGNNH